MLLHDILTKGLNPPWNMYSTISNIKGLQSMLDSYTVPHCYRECNQAANWAASNARSGKSSSKWADPYPPDLVILL